MTSKEIRSSKSEILNKCKIVNPNGQNDMLFVGVVSRELLHDVKAFEPSNFEFVSDFGFPSSFGISQFTTVGLAPAE